MGRSGEERAADFYLRTGFELLARNWRCPAGEVDLIARDGGTIVFCEVKTRSSFRFGSPAEAVSRPKQLRLRRLAAAWFGEQRRAGLYYGDRARFDVVCVVGTDVQVIEDAF